MISSSQKQGINLWFGPQSKKLAYSYYNLLAQQIFDEEEDPINQHSIFKNVQSKRPRMLIFDTQIDRLKKLRQVDHKKIIKKIQHSSQNFSSGLQDYFGNIDISSMINYSKQYNTGFKEHSDKDKELQQWGQFINWKDSESNYVQIDTNYANLQLDSSKTIGTEAFMMSYEHNQQYYKNNKDICQNKIRKELEECDYLKYLGLTSDELFGGFTVNVLQYLSDQCPKIVKSILQLSVPNKQIQISLPTFSQIHELSDIYVPISSPQYLPFQLSEPELYDPMCRRRMSKNINLAPLISMFYTPFNMKQTNVDHYVNNLVLSNHKLFNSAYTIPIIRKDSELGPVKEQDQEKLRIQEGVFSFERVARQIWKSKYTKKEPYYIGQQLQKQQDSKYFLNFTNRDFLSIGPKGGFNSQSYIFKGHFNKLEKLLQPRCENFSLKYLQGIFSLGETPKIKYMEPSQEYSHNYLHYYSHEQQNISSYPYQTVLFNHQSFGPNIRTVVKEKIRNTKYFSQNFSEWKNRIFEIADSYMEESHGSDEEN